MEPARTTLGARCVRMPLDSEEHYRARAWQVHRFPGTPSRTWGSSDQGWHQMAYRSQRSGPSTGLSNTRWDQELCRVAPYCSAGTLISLRASWLAAIRPIATSSISLVYLRASWTKANLPQGRGAKPRGLFLGKVAGLPKGDC